jgi:1-deoxy-D-xylulose-5-phosphate synthase
MSSGSVLSRISSPADLKTLTPSELETLSCEIRDKMVEVVSKNGGHLASNLGAVELTIGLHLAFDGPTDKIVWDVGHQCYAHKMLTGRLGAIDTLRTFGGLSGFPKHEESPYDVFDSGHASTSISFALGLAEARDMVGGTEHVVAVIGDGSLTGGVSYEALNQAGHLGTRLIVVLNDNEMSIADNVGAMSRYLARARLDPAYNRLRDDIEARISRLPGGKRVVDFGEHVKEAVKQYLVPGMLFEELGFKYVGPIAGHDIGLVVDTLSRAKQTEGPVLVHVVTTKGAGYQPAECGPEKFHGISPFDPDTGETPSKGTKAYTDVFADAMLELGDKDPRVVAITAAMKSGTGLTAFAERYPDRFFDVGIAEQHAVTFAGGLARAGRLPVVAIYSTFLARAYDQVIQDVALQGTHVVFAVDRGGLVGEDGPTHHGAYDLTYLRAVPEMVVMAPSDAKDLRDMLYAAADMPGPVAIRYPRGEAAGQERLCEPSEEIVLGRGRVLERGETVCLLAVGDMVARALAAAELLAAEGVTASVVDMRFVKPIDRELASWAATDHELVVTLEDNSVIGGLGAAVLEALADSGHACRAMVLGIPDRFVTHGPIPRLMEELGLDAQGIAEKVHSALQEMKHGRRKGRRLLSGKGLLR